MYASTRSSRRFATALLALLLSLSAPPTAGAQTPAPNARAEDGATSGGAAPVAPVAEAAPAERPARAVSLVAPRMETWSDQVEAHGNIMPWQETRISTEIGGLRLVNVLANVGDVVKKGQTLARLNPATIQIELETAEAQLMEAQATQAQAVATLQRAKRLAASGGVSQQELMQYETQKQTAEARLNAAQAQVKKQHLRLESATLVAPDDGIISARSASEGAIVSAGSELFRLIRQGRLEWRAEVKQDLLLKLAAGQEVTVYGPVGPPVAGRVRQVSPTIDLATRTGTAYVDLPSDANLRAGLAVSGAFSVGKRKSLILPLSAVRHDGDDSQVLVVGPEGTIAAVDVRVGTIKGDRIEIVSGLDGRTKVVADEVGSLKPGDPVRLLETDGREALTQAPIPSREPAN